MTERPQRVTFFHADKPGELAIVEAFSLGVEAHGSKFRQVHLSEYTEESGPNDWTECAVLYGVKNNKPSHHVTRKVFFDYKDAGRHVIHIDAGYLRPQEYCKVSVDAFHPTDYFRNISRPPDRFKRLGLDLKPWKENLLRHVLVVNDHPMYGECWYRIDMAAWAKKIARRVKGRTVRPVLWYPVGREWMRQQDLATEWAEVCGRSAILDELLQTAHSVVVFTSSVALQALLEGVPIFVYGDDCVARSMAGDPRWIERPRCPDDAERLQFFSDLAYVQWTRQEMWAGECWEALWT